MCYAKSERKNRDEVRKWFASDALGLDVLEPIPEFEPRYRLSIKEMIPIARPTGDGDNEVQLELAHWDLIPPGKSKPFLRANARSDSLRAKWPWKMLLRNRCVVPADGFYEPEKPAMTKGTVPWSFYQLIDGGLFLMPGLFNEAADPKTGELVTTYTIITTDANDLIAGRKHNRMPAILRPEDAREWLFADELPDHLLAPYPSSEMVGYRVTDRAKNRREQEGPDMVEPIG
jgi:putative SOS response-associated peptidase YedK